MYRCLRHVSLELVGVIVWGVLWKLGVGKSNIQKEGDGIGEENV